MSDNNKMNTNGTFDINAPSTSKETSNFIKNDKENSLEGLQSSDGLFLHGVKTSKNEITTQVKNKRTSQMKNKRFIQNCQNVNMDDGDQLIEKVFQEVCKSMYPIPKIKFNFCKIISSKENYVIDNQEPNIALKSEAFASSSITEEKIQSELEMKKTKFDRLLEIEDTCKKIVHKKEKNVTEILGLTTQIPVKSEKLVKSDNVLTEGNKRTPEIKTKKTKNKHRLLEVETQQKNQKSPTEISIPTAEISGITELFANTGKVSTEGNIKKTKSKKTKNKETSLEISDKQIINSSSPRSTVKNTSADITENLKKRKKKKPKPQKDEVFENYFTEEDVTAGLNAGLMLTGPIRINQRNYREAYVTSKENDKDFLIEGVKNRNRALEGDTVVVLINPKDKWKNSESGLQKTGKVVRISNYVHKRICVGLLNFRKPNIKKTDFYMFYPRDSRLPELKIVPSTLSEEVMQNSENYINMIWSARIDKWDEVNFANGTVLQMIGTCGDLESETTALLMEHNLDAEPLPAEFAKYYPKIPFTIPAMELEKRTDLRRECIFTIDPATARDLDDAVSCKELANGNFEVGVHISDVTYFLENDTPLDVAVSERATTIYLVQRVYHMLPVDLCEMCSLTPGEDKLAFSVIFEMTPDAVVVNERFCRSVIHSCTKFAYEHAQLVIDNPDKEWSREDFPEIGNEFGPADCAATVKMLYKLSVIMRERRFSTGALRINMPKLCFSLDGETNRPTSCFVYVNKESHRLIEEFMLLANMAVAKHIYEAHPKLAFLRNHSPPHSHLMVSLQKKLSKLGINLDIISAGSIHNSLEKYLPATPSDPFEWLHTAILYNLCSRPMKRAQYFNPDSEMDEEEFHHFALNSPFYTHFTSPIRRYADVMVHRLLAATIGFELSPSWVPDYCQKVASTCNLKKHSAKLAGDQSSMLFLALFLEDHGPITTKAGVFEVKDKSFDCIIYNYGVSIRIYVNQNPKLKTSFTEENGLSSLDIEWEGSIKQTIEVFSVVDVQISKCKKMVKVEGELLPPS